MTKLIGTAIEHGALWLLGAVSLAGASVKFALAALFQ